MTETLIRIENINRREDRCPFNIEAVNKKYKSKYVGAFCLRDRDGDWINQPAYVFWQAKVPQPGFSNYFALVQGLDNQVLITSGESAFSEPIYCIVANDGEVIYSAYRHDFYQSRDGSAFIDGGRDYTRGSRVADAELRIIDGDFYLVDHHEEPQTDQVPG